MIINIENISEMVWDLSCMFGISPVTLINTVQEFRRESSSGICYYEDKFIKLSEEFVKKHQKKHIKEVYVAHLTRHIESPKELKPLIKLLNEENEFTHFLRNNQVTFTNCEDYISMNYKGKKVETKELYDENTTENEHCRLAGRLGCCGIPDYCINGFAFAIKPELSTDGYYEYLSEGPELLQDLDNFLNTNLCKKYKEKSKYYISIFKVKLEDIIFDNITSFNGSINKEINYLILCFMFLSSYYCDSSSVFNEVIRLNDFQTVEVDHNILIE